MIKIVIFNRKGGVGKTYTTVNLAGCFDKYLKKDVLVVDCDAQGNTTSCLTINEDVTIEHSLSDIFNDCDIDIRHSIKMYDRNKEIKTRIDLIPADIRLDNIETQNMYTLNNYLKEFEQDYDYCLMDCPPDLTETALNALCAADYVIIPTFSGRDSVNGYGMVIDEINTMKENGYNPNLEVMGILLNAIDKRRSLEKYYTELWKNETGERVFETSIRDSADIANAYEFGKPIHYYKPHCPAAKDYELLAKEINNKVMFRR